MTAKDNRFKENLAMREVNAICKLLGLFPPQVALLSRIKQELSSLQAGRDGSQKAISQLPRNIKCARSSLRSLTLRDTLMPCVRQHIVEKVASFSV